MIKMRHTDRERLERLERVIVDVYKRIDNLQDKVQELEQQHNRHVNNLETAHKL